MGASIISALGAGRLLLHRGSSVHPLAAAAVTTELIKELRARTGAPIASVKAALIAEDGDLDAAFDRLRRMGAKLASKRAERAASEGLVGLLRATGDGAAVLVELNCETDFVSRNAVFYDLLASLASSALEMPGTRSSSSHVDIDVAELAGIGGNDARMADAGTALGENIRLNRATIVRGPYVGGYVHGLMTCPPDANGDMEAGRIGVTVALGAGESSDSTAAVRSLALHIAAEAPIFLSHADVSTTLLENERSILLEAARAEELSKPNAKPRSDAILGRMIDGQLNKWFGQVVLNEQPMLIADSNATGKPPTVRKWLEQRVPGVDIHAFSRLAVGQK
jgi:elongation factor Ts